MKSNLIEHNLDPSATYKFICPECGEWMRVGEKVQYTKPQRRFVYCLSCGYKGAAINLYADTEVLMKELQLHYEDMNKKSGSIWLNEIKEK